MAFYLNSPICLIKETVLKAVSFFIYNNVTKFFPGCLYYRIRIKPLESFHNTPFRGLSNKWKASFLINTLNDIIK